MDHIPVKSISFSAVYGPFYKLACFTGILIPVESRWPKWKKLLTYIPSLILAILFLARGFYLGIKFKQAEMLTKYWCYIVPCAFLAFLAMISTVTLIFLKKRMFFKKFMDDLAHVSHKSITPVSSRTLILCAIFVFMCIGGAIILCVENILTYNNGGKNCMDNSSFTEFKLLLEKLEPNEPILQKTDLTIHDICTVYNPQLDMHKAIMFGGPVMYPVHIFIIVIGAYVFSVTMVIFVLSIQSLTNSYEKFNNEIKNAIREENEKLQNDVALLRDIENRLIDYQSLAETIFKLFGAFVSMAYMIGIIVHCAAAFAMRAYIANMTFLQQAVFVAWTGIGLIMVALSLNRPTMFYHMTIETKEILWQNKFIISSPNDQFLHILGRIKSRICDASYGRHLMASVKTSLLSIKAILFIILFGIDIVVAFWKKANL